MLKEAKTVCILGAGPAGISAAYFAQEKGLNVILVEEKAQVGGKGASRRIDNYIFDFGPHAYHAKSEAINQLILSHAGDEYLRLIVKMDLILKGQHLNYPLSLTQALRKFNPLFSLKLIADYLWIQTVGWVKPLPEESFRDWGLKKFGKTLYDLCFGNYTERVWKVSARELSVELARRKLPRFSIKSLLQDLFFKRGKMHSHMFTNELGYHREGIGSIYENIVAGIIQRGGTVLRETTVGEIRSSSPGGPMELTLRGNAAQSLTCDYVISTIPLPTLLSTLGRTDARFGPLASRLSFRHILLVYVVLEMPRFSAAHWTYLVDERFHFHRISEQKNLSAACAPGDQTVLTMEISCHEDDPMWNWQPEQWREMVTRDLSFFGVAPSQITKIYRSQLRDAYPIYAINYEKELAATLQELERLPNLITTGRQGLFLDIDMHDAMVLGKNSVEAVVGGSVGAFYAKNSIPFKPRE
jgi:protoporphyrinogen oxidase